MSKIGILAYGSLIQDPGPDLEQCICRRIDTTTPFPVEYARLSQTRGGAPTVAPHPLGGPVKAQVLVLDDSVHLEKARTLLWQRETHREGSGREYRESCSPNAVIVRDKPGLCELDHVLYTDFNPSGKLENPDARELAVAAMDSVGKAEEGKDGISYLMDLITAGVVTPLTARYEEEILALIGAHNLAEALEVSRSKEKTA